MKKSLLVASLLAAVALAACNKSADQAASSAASDALLLLRQLLVLRATLRLLLRQRLLRATLLLQWRRLLRQRRLLRLRAQASKPRRQLKKTGPRPVFRLSFLRLSHGSRTGPPSGLPLIRAPASRSPHPAWRPRRPRSSPVRRQTPGGPVPAGCSAGSGAPRQVLEAAALQRREDVRCGVIAQVAVVAADTRLQRLRIAARGQHRGIVVGFEHQRVTAAQDGRDVRRGHPDVRQHRAGWRRP